MSVSKCHEPLVEGVESEARVAATVWAGSGASGVLGFEDTHEAEVIPSAIRMIDLSPLIDHSPLRVLRKGLWSWYAISL